MIWFLNPTDFYIKYLRLAISLGKYILFCLETLDLIYVYTSTCKISILWCCYAIIILLSLSSISGDVLETKQSTMFQTSQTINLNNIYIKSTEGKFFFKKNMLFLQIKLSGHLLCPSEKHIATGQIWEYLPK